MEHKVDGDLDWEWLQVVGRGQLWDEQGWVCHVDLLAQKSGAKVQVKTALKMLLDKFIVKRHFAKSFKLLWDVV